MSNHLDSYINSTRSQLFFSCRTGAKKVRLAEEMKERIEAVLNGQSVSVQSKREILTIAAETKNIAEVGHLFFNGSFGKTSRFKQAFEEFKQDLDRMMLERR